MATDVDFYARNSAYALPPQEGSYLTKLLPQDETRFQQWVKDNKVPFDSSEKADYDMRGYWMGLQSGILTRAQELIPMIRNFTTLITGKLPTTRRFLQNRSGPKKELLDGTTRISLSHLTVK